MWFLGRNLEDDGFIIGIESTRLISGVRRHGELVNSLSRNNGQWFQTVLQKLKLTAIRFS